jgi:hypothetical protein
LFAVRRLPVIQESPEAEPRPAWKVLPLGIGLVFILWLPLAMLALPLGPRLAQALLDLPQDLRVSSVVVEMSSTERWLFAAIQAGPSLLAFALAAGAGAAIVQGQGASLAQAALAGLGAAGLAWLLALLGGALTPWFFALAVLLFLGALGAGSGWCGARIARIFLSWRARSRRPPPAE